MTFRIARRLRITISTLLNPPPPDNNVHGFDNRCKHGPENNFLNRNRCTCIYCGMSKPAIALPCMCASFRRAARVLTQHYDAAMRPLGLRGTQFTLLQALSLAGEVSQGLLGEILAIDSTTLTRTLAIMGRRGWIVSRSGKDRRERWLSLSEAGKAEFRRARPHWEKVQRELRVRLGNKLWNDLFNLTNQLTPAVK
jgi:DNA-binding MarR family transcriptional regulator